MTTVGARRRSGDGIGGQLGWERDRKLTNWIQPIWRNVRNPNSAR
jgi:hypothetical protein